MIITDTLSNFFSKIKNGYLAKKNKIIQSGQFGSVNVDSFVVITIACAYILNIQKLNYG